LFFVVLGVLEIVDDEQDSSSKQSPKPPESTRFLLKSKNGNGDGERKCKAITFTGSDLTEMQEQGEIEGLFDDFL
jgi:hypothetical protein